MKVVFFKLYYFITSEWYFITAQFIYICFTMPLWHSKIFYDSVTLTLNGGTETFQVSIKY